MDNQIRQAWWSRNCLFNCEIWPTI